MRILRMKNIRCECEKRCQPFKCQPYQITKHTQIIGWQQPTICLGVLDHFMRLALKTLSRIFRECLFSSAQVHSENRGLSHELISHAKVWCGLIQYVRRGQSKQTKDKQTTLSKCILTPKNIWTSLLYLCNIYLRYETTKIRIWHYFWPAFLS